MRKEFRTKLNGDQSRKNASASFTLPFDTREVCSPNNLGGFLIFLAVFKRGSEGTVDASGIGYLRG
jgi:hypothetical protein